MADKPYRCNGTKPNGKPCNWLFFRGWWSEGEIDVICPRCNKPRTWRHGASSLDSELELVVH